MVTYNKPKRNGSGRGVRANAGRHPACKTPRTKAKR